MLINRTALPTAVIIFFVTFFLESPAFSQPPEKKHGDTYNLGEITVTATRHEKHIADTGVPASATTRDEINDLAPRSTGQLLDHIPGVHAAEEGALNTGKPVMRGFHGSRVLVMIDGQRLQSSLGGIWGGPEVSLVDPDLLERIEVIYGPASSLYGSDALGGAINLITRKAPLSQKAYSACSVNSYYMTNGKGNRENIRAEAGGKRYAFGLSATNRQMNDYHTPDEKMQDSGYKMRSGSFDMTFRPAEKHTFVFTAQINRNRDLERPPSESPAAVTKIETTDYNRLKLGVDYAWADISSHIHRLAVKAYYQRDDSEFTFDGDIHPFPGLSIQTSSTGDSELETIGLQGQIDFSVTGKSYTVFGFDYYYNSSGPNKTKKRSRTRIMGFRRPEERSVSIAEDGNADSLGIFLQNEIQVAERIDITLGLRYDWYRSRISPHGADKNSFSRSSTDSALTGSCSVVYRLTDCLRWYVNVAKGFRAPTLRDLYYRGPVPGGLMSKGNPSLDPETSITVNTGFKFSSRRLSGALTVFRSDVDDLIVSVNKPPQERGDPAAGIVTKENLGEARLWGIETWLTARLSRSFTYDLNFSYTQGKDMVHRWPLQAVPPARLRQMIRWDDTVPFSGGLRAWAELSCTYRFRQNRIARDWDTERMRTPGHARWDFRCGMNLPTVYAMKRAEIYIAVTNITDKRYTEFPLYDGYDLLTMPGIGATFGLRCTW